MIRMKIKDTFLVHEAGNETMLVPTGGASFSGVVRGNQTLGAILGLLKAETTEEEIVSELCKRYEVTRDVVERDVKQALETLRRIDALDE